MAHTIIKRLVRAKSYAGCTGRYLSWKIVRDNFCWRAVGLYQMSNLKLKNCQSHHAWTGDFSAVMFPHLVTV